jgi:anaerobic selenocysteine-containing dehydrogenase
MAQSTIQEIGKETLGASTNTAPSEAKSYDKELPVQTHYRTCNLCEAMCGIKVEYQGEHLLKIAGDPDDQHSKGYICPKGYALQDLHNDPERLKTPLKRVGDKWLPIDWDQAFDEVAERLVGVQQKYGNDSVAAYWGNPTAHNLGLILALPPFRNSLNSRNMHAGSSVDQLPHMVNAYLMFGNSLLFSIPDIDRTDYMLMIGANPAASNGSLMTAGDVKARLKGITQRGGKLVIVDPRKTETTKFASEHLFVKPGTDALLLVGLIQVIVNQGLGKPLDHLPLNGKIADLSPLVNTIPLARIAQITSIPEAEITRIATEFATAESAVCYGRWGMSVQEFGGLNHYLMQMLNIVTGNLDRAGGMMFTTPAADLLSIIDNDGYDRYRSRVHNMPEAFGELPIAHLPDEILTQGEGQVRAFVCTSANPVISSPNGTKVEEALASLDFMVSIDFYLNETSRLADIILPPTGPFEHEQYDLIFNMLAVRNITKFSPPLFEQKSYMRSDNQIFKAITKRINKLKSKGNISAQIKSTALSMLGDYLTPERAVDLMLRTGPYGDGVKGLLNPLPTKGLTLKKVKEQVHGIDLGPMQPRMPEILCTPDKRIALYPEVMVKDFERLQEHFGEDYKPDALTLISRRDLRTNNSWMHNSRRLVKGKNRCTLLVHPETAKQFCVTDGEIVKLSSRIGSIKVPAQLTENMMPGVVSLPHGWGHHREGMKISVASAHAGVSINDITDESRSDPVTGTSAFTGMPVTIEKIV